MVDTQMVHSMLMSALPRVFHPALEEEAPRPLDALLEAMESAFFPMHESLERLETYLDWASAPHDANHDFLSWLGTWVGMSLWPEWTEAKKRFVVSQAVRLYQYRGTRVVLEYLIGLFLDLEVTIREWDWPQGLVIGNTSTIGLDGPLMNQPNIKQCFVVCWDIDQVGLDQNSVRALHQVIQAEKPAHTAYYVQIRMRGAETPKNLKKLIIEESSIIGEFFIEGED